jgi:hypothetical protein
MLAPSVSAYRRGVRTPLKLAGIAACLAAGMLLATVVAGGVRAQDTTTTTTIEETTTETTTETTSEPTTVLTTATVEHTTTRQIILPAATTTSSSSTGDTPAWVWVLLGVLAVALVILIVLLARRPGSGVAPAERRRRLDGAVASWTTQGWALESQSGDSAVLQRGGERMIVSVDQAGQVGTRPL